MKRVNQQFTAKWSAWLRPGAATPGRDGTPTTTTGEEHWCLMVKQPIGRIDFLLEFMDVLCFDLLPNRLIYRSHEIALERTAYNTEC